MSAPIQHGWLEFEDWCHDLLVQAGYFDTPPNPLWHDKLIQLLPKTVTNPSPTTRPMMTINKYCKKCGSQLVLCEETDTVNGVMTQISVIVTCPHDGKITSLADIVTKAQVLDRKIHFMEGDMEIVCVPGERRGLDIIYNCYRVPVNTRVIDEGRRLDFTLTDLQISKKFAERLEQTE